MINNTEERLMPICYRDMTFCRTYNVCAKGEKCWRALTPEVQKRADELGLPIAEFVRTPECFKAKEIGFGEQKEMTLDDV